MSSVERQRCMTRLPLILLLALTCGIGFPQEIDKGCEREVFLGNETITPAADCVVEFLDLAFDPDGNLWVADGFRVLRFPQSTLPLTEPSVADIVIGKPGFTVLENPRDDGTCEEGSDAICWLNDPRRVRFDGLGRLWVGAESILRFSPPFSTGMAADFTLALPSLGFEGGLLFDQDGNLWITDYRPCTRILRLPAPVSADTAPDLVLGQPDQETCLPPEPGPNRFFNFGGRDWITFDNDGNLLVTDNGSNRVLVFRPPFSDFMDASAALGQNDLNSFEPLPFDQGGLAFLASLEVDFLGKLWLTHNLFFVSAYAPPFETGQQRLYWFDFNSAVDGPLLPSAFTRGYQRFRFLPDGSFQFFVGTWTARLEMGNLSPGGVVNGASFLAGGISPGQIASAFGIQLGFRGGLTGTVEKGRLLNGLGKTMLTVNGIPAPIFFANFEQINFQVPFEIDLSQPARVEVSIDGFRGPPEFVSVVPVSPGIFTLPDGTAAVVNHEGIVGPLEPGQFGVVFVTGLGLVEDDLETGALTPSDRLFRVTTPVEVFINGVPCNVLFAGLTPDFVGLYQVNFEIPSDLPDADSYEIVILQGGTQSNTAPVAVD